MATPKKKVSKSRRNMRRFSAAYKLDPVTYVRSSINEEFVRPHSVTIDTVAAYVAKKKEDRQKRKSA